MCVGMCVGVWVVVGVGMWVQVLVVCVATYVLFCYVCRNVQAMSLVIFAIMCVVIHVL